MTFFNGMVSYKQIEFPLFEDDRGDLIPFELNEHFPFPVKRVYLVTAKNKALRGSHAHKIESELFVAAQGSIKALVNDGSVDKVIELRKKNQALLVHPFCWHEFYDFSEDAVLLCFSSTHYLPGDENYITNKSDFLADN
jgi:dTDP-4-dehydrorhamnose 3,5-epimerase-like enzyme